jgi:phytol kinase
MLQNNILAFIVTLLIAVLWLRVIDQFAHKGLISTRVSRKIIHIGTGPLFVLCWLLFDDAPGARYLAAIIPLLITFQFALVGLSVIKDKAAVEAMSRTGNPREILKGPLFYGVAFITLTILFWKDNPIGIIGLIMLCGGDGMADLIGRKYGRVKLPWSKSKSFAGSMAVLFFGSSLTWLVIGIFSLFELTFRPFSQHLLPIGIIAGIVTAVESIPIGDIDNITIPLASILAGLIFYP